MKALRGFCNIRNLKSKAEFPTQGKTYYSFERRKNTGFSADAWQKAST